jgi:hypothetical protein
VERAGTACADAAVSVIGADGSRRTSTSRLVLAAACFALALGLPFGRAAEAGGPGAIILVPILVQEVGSFAHGPNGEVIAIPGRLRMQLSPLYMPPWSITSGGAPLGRAVTARVPLVALLAAASLAARRRSFALARRAALAGGIALAATGVVAALPSPGAVASIVGVALLATIGALGCGVRGARST